LEAAKSQVCYLRHMDKTAGSAKLPGGGSAPDVKVVDRRWWARGEQAEPVETPVGKPTYVEELEARIAEKDRLLQEYIQQYKSAAAEFDQSRARSRREVAKEVERGKRALLVDLLEIVDNLDRAIESAQEARSVETLLAGVSMVRQQFLQRLEGYGIQPIEPLNETFDPMQHEAVTVVPAPPGDDEERVVGVIRRGYRIGDEVLRPAQVAVGKRVSVEG
jgi:molecular chaperone GrpE